MAKHPEKIVQLLRSRDERNVEIGIQLISGSDDVLLIRDVLLEDFHLSYKTIIQLANIFKQKAVFWEDVAQSIKQYCRIKDDLQTWINRTTLGTDIYPKPIEFCRIVNKEMKVLRGNFPKLSPDLLELQHSSNYHSHREGKSVDEAGIGWFFSIFEEDTGPAETIHNEKWLAIAYHPDGEIRFEYDYNYKTIWKEGD